MTIDQPERYRSTTLALIGGLMLVVSACGSAAAESETASAGDVVPIQTDETNDANNTDGAADGAGSDIGSDETTDPDADSPIEASTIDPVGGTATIEDAQDAYREFTDCMRNEGIEMPPAVFDADGKIDIDAQLAYFQNLDPSEVSERSFTEQTAAEEQCIPDNAEELLAMISPDASEVEQLQDDLNSDLDTQLTELAKCMRKQFPDFPDPVAFDIDFSEDEGPTEFNPFPGIDTDDPLYASAVDDCAKSVGLGAVAG